MLAVDTNVLVRLVTNDEPEQAKSAAAVFRSSGITIAKTVLLETEWVLRHGYGLDRSAIRHAIQSVLGLPNVVAEDQTQVTSAMDWFDAGLDFADALHLASSGAAERFATFDDKLAKRAKGLVPLKITKI
jgi:predicted nucleic-acid-binding protein